jgi:hypothetical protein
MAAPYQCECGLRTRAPFMINGELMCAVCAEKVAPRLVNQRTARNWFEFQNASRMGPTRPGYRARWTESDA